MQTSESLGGKQRPMQPAFGWVTEFDNPAELAVSKRRMIHMCSDILLRGCYLGNCKLRMTSSISDSYGNTDYFAYAACIVILAHQSSTETWKKVK